MSKSKDSGGGDRARAFEELKEELFFERAGSAPNSGRFQKGQSGNPKGRPRRSHEPVVPIGMQPTKAILLSEAKRPVQIRDGDGHSQISAVEGLIRAVFASALKGHPYAQRTLLEKLDRVEREEAREIAEEHAFWEDYQDHCRSRVGAVRETGEVIEPVLPHPDDVVIEPGRRVRFVGPLNEAQAVKFEEYCRLRDALILQDALDQKLSQASGTRRSAERPGGALLLAVVINNLLPKRLQVAEGLLTRRMLQLEAASRRQLLKDAFQSWRVLGVSRQRGLPFPSLDQIQHALEWRFALIGAFRSGELDADAIRRGEFDDKARAFLDEWR